MRRPTRPAPPAPLSRPFRLVVAGWPILSDSAGNIVALRTKKHVALLVRIAVEAGRTYTRRSLQELLWSSVNDEALANHSLSQTLSALKAVLGRDALVLPPGAVALRKGIVTVVTEGEWGFLDGFEIADAPNWDDWVAARRAGTWRA